MPDIVDFSPIRTALDAKDYATVVSLVRQAFDSNPTAAINDPVIQNWLGVRFRNLFLNEAMGDPDAIKHAKAMFPLDRFDHRPERQQLAEQNFRHFDLAELELELPVSEVEDLSERTLLFLPGLLTGLLPVLAFQSVWPYIMDRFGLRVVASDSHPGRSSKANVADLLNVIEKGIGVNVGPEGGFITSADNPQPIEGDFVAMGYSKGGPDFLTMLVEHPEIASRVKGIVGWAGAFGGSFAADEIYKTLQKLPDAQVVGKFDVHLSALLARMAPVINSNHLTRRLDEYNIKEAIESLTTTFRSRFIAEHEETLRSFNIPGFYFTGATSIIEVPYFQMKGTLDLDHYDQDNDMQLIQTQATIPGNSTRLAMIHANHWDLSYDSFPWYETGGSHNLKNPFPRRVAMVAIVQTLGEIGVLR